MITTIVLALFSAVLIYLSCEYFVNGIEWVGKRFAISKNAVGTVLAAFGTALPESVVTFVAVVFGATAGQKDIGVGAALGGPLVLSTLAYAVVGVSIYVFQRGSFNALDINRENLRRDQLWFLIIFVFKVALGLFIFAGKMWTGLLFFVAYGVYVFKEMHEEVEQTNEILQPLKFRPKSVKPETIYILLQTILALIFIYIGSQIFVKQLEYLSSLLGVPPHIIALLLSPVATELPEILNAVIWVRQGKVSLALANISGAMMIQATIPSALGILFTPWLFDKNLILAALVTAAAILFLLFAFKKRKLSAKYLSFNALFYVAFIVVFAIWNK